MTMMITKEAYPLAIEYNHTITSWAFAEFGGGDNVVKQGSAYYSVRSAASYKSR